MAKRFNCVPTVKSEVDVASPDDCSYSVYSYTVQRHILLTAGIMRLAAFRLHSLVAGWLVPYHSPTRLLQLSACRHAPCRRAILLLSTYRLLPAFLPFTVLLQPLALLLGHCLLAQHCRLSLIAFQLTSATCRLPACCIDT